LKEEVRYDAKRKTKLQKPILNATQGPNLQMTEFDPECFVFRVVTRVS